MKKYLVVGGFGFIGHRVTRELCELGHEVQVLDLCKPYQGTGETQVPYDRRTISPSRCFGEFRFIEWTSLIS